MGQEPESCRGVGVVSGEAAPRDPEAPGPEGPPPASWPWPTRVDALVRVQEDLAAAANAVLIADPWRLPPPGWPELRLAGCFVAFARGHSGPGSAGDPARAAAVVCRPLTGRPLDVEQEAVVSGTTVAGYLPGLLALREGPLLAAAVGDLTPRPDLLLVDATGRDHPRRAGMALHLGAHTGIPTVGVTHRPLLAQGTPPPLERGASSPIVLGGEEVGRWVCTRAGTRPVVAHAGWRTGPATAAEVVLAASVASARAPVPLREARRAARLARAVAEGRTPPPPAWRP
jgi:deoxyribonuclease V